MSKKRHFAASGIQAEEDLLYREVVIHHYLPQQNVVSFLQEHLSTQEFNTIYQLAKDRLTWSRFSRLDPNHIKIIWEYLTGTSVSHFLRLNTHYYKTLTLSMLPPHPYRILNLTRVIEECNRLKKTITTKAFQRKMIKPLLLEQGIILPLQGHLIDRNKELYKYLKKQKPALLQEDIIQLPTRITTYCIPSHTQNQWFKKLKHLHLLQIKHDTPLWGFNDMILPLLESLWILPVNYQYAENYYSYTSFFEYLKKCKHLKQVVVGIGIHRYTDIQTSLKDIPTLTDVRIICSTSHFKFNEAGISNITLKTIHIALPLSDVKRYIRIIYNVNSVQYHMDFYTIEKDEVYERNTITCIDYILHLRTLTQDIDCLL